MCKFNDNFPIMDKSKNECEGEISNDNLHLRNDINPSDEDMEADEIGKPFLDEGIAYDKCIIEKGDLNNKLLLKEHEDRLLLQASVNLPEFVEQSIINGSSETPKEAVISCENKFSTNDEEERKPLQMEVDPENKVPETFDRSNIFQSNDIENMSQNVQDVGVHFENSNNDVQKCDDTPKSLKSDMESDEVVKPTTKESAFQRLASLGVIAEEKPVIETKESVLKKLASRGAISITPASLASVPSSSVSITPVAKSISTSPSPVETVLVSPIENNVVSIKSLKPTSANSTSVKSSPVKKIAPQNNATSAPVQSTSIKPGIVAPTTVSSSTAMSVTVDSAPLTPTKPNHKPGPKSAKAKKIKIDPGKSLDIDKDFNSLINFLSTGADLSNSPVISGTSDIKGSTSTGEPVKSNNLDSSKPEHQLDINEGSNNQSTNDDPGNGMELDTNDDRSIHETDSESRDGVKSFDQVSETEEKQVIISKNKNVIEEGSAEILLSTNKNVFYNKVQEFNRDMSIAALTVFSDMHQQDPRTRNRGKKRKVAESNDSQTNCTGYSNENVFEPGKKAENGITILEALSATGLRSIRYAREIPGVKEIIANDLSEDAVDTIKKNIGHNRVEDLVTTSMSDASLLMYKSKANEQWYDAIDLDPYGCPSRFLDAAVQAVADGGLLLVTCTDMAILAGNSPETCYVKYGAISLRTPACHEMALRIALQCIESHANRYGRYIAPLLSFHADFYIRLIVQVYTSPVTCKRTSSKLSMVYQCTGCGTHSFHPLGQTIQPGHNNQPKFSLVPGPPVDNNCAHCHHRHFIGGPIWTAPLYSIKFLESMLKVLEKGRFATAKRMQGMLEVIKEELQDIPLFYSIASLCTKLHCEAIPLIDIRSAILNAGYRVSSSHTAPTAIKTNAPARVIWDIMRCWVHMNPISQKRLVAGSVPEAIIMEPPVLIANFDIHPRAQPSSAARKLLRYQQNPEKNWGPGVRARCNNIGDTKDEKRRLNQNKNKNKKHIDIIEVVTIDDEDEPVNEEQKPTSEALQTSSNEPQ